MWACREGTLLYPISTFTLYCYSCYVNCFLDCDHNHQNFPFCSGSQLFLASITPQRQLWRCLKLRTSPGQSHKPARIVTPEKLSVSTVTRAAKPARSTISNVAHVTLRNKDVLEERRNMLFVHLLHRQSQYLYHLCQGMVSSRVPVHYFGR